VNQQLTSKTYTGEAFAKALEAGSLRASIVRTGMVKRDAEDPKVVLFTESGCDGWIKVPIEMIEEVAHLSSARCKDHDHPVVQIRFKEPDDGPARVFADLARAAANLPLSFDERIGDDVAPDGVFRQSGGGGTTGGTGGGLDGCKCIGYEWNLRWVRIRVPGGFLWAPIRTRGQCTIYECSPR
jgi:hypothetical protein